MSKVNRAITASDERVHLVALYDFFLDDAGLNPFEYRAYMRIVRRAGGGRSACTESLENMAIGCRMSRRAMVGAIKALIKRHMIRRESKSGQVSTYVLMDKSTWILDETTWAPDAQVEEEGWAPYAQGVGTICPGGGHHMPTKNTNKNTIKNTKEESAHAREAVVISQETTAARPHTPQGIDPVAIALEAFPAMPIYHQETIDNADITQSHLWRKAVADWKANGWSKRNITGLVDYYYRLEKQESRDKEYQNGQNGRNNKRESHNERAARETIEYIERLTGTSIRDSDAHPADTIFKLPAAFGGK